nr:MAG: hypothetical protein DIU78_24390 [Pseudomonadota bacterium]
MAALLSFESGFVRRVLGVSVLAFGLGLAPAAAGQTDETRAAARALATEGAQAFQEGRWEDAIDRFGRAESLVHAPPHLLFMARAHEKLGQLVLAREAYLKVVREPLPANAPQAFKDAQADAERELRAVEPRIARLLVRVEGAEKATDLSVVVDGQAVPPALVGVGQPIDPGRHRVEAQATGFTAEPREIELAEGASDEVVLTLVPAAVAGATPEPPAPSTPEPVNPLLDTSVQTSRPNQGMRIGSYVAFGVGAIGLGLGTYFLIDAAKESSAADEAFEKCTAAGSCLESDPYAKETAEHDDAARSARRLSIVSFAVGGVGIAAGTALLILSNSSRSEGGVPAATVRPYFGFGQAGLLGTF